VTLTRSPARTAADALAAFVTTVEYDRIPPGEQLRAKQRIADAVLCAAVGRSTVAARLVRGFGLRSGARGPSTFWLSGRTGSPEDCAFANGALVHGALHDDDLVHTACAVVPAGVAVAEAEGRSGADLVAAVALGYEVVLRLDAGGLAHRAMERGHRHSWPAVFGATAAAASLMRLTADEARSALALTAATCNPGTIEPLGKADGTERFVQMATSAKLGVFSASLARDGFTGTASALDGPAGLFFAYTGEAGAPAGLADGLGEEWHLDRMRVKPYPCSGLGTLTAYCAEQLVREHGLEHGEVAAAHMRMRHWGQMDAVADRGPFTSLEQALISSPFVVATTLAHGRYDLDTVLRAIGDELVDDVARRVELTGVPGLPDEDHELTVTTTDGRTLVAGAAHMPRELIYPPDWSAMAARFHALARGLPLEWRERALREVAELDRRADCRALVELLYDPVLRPSGTGLP
jgi:2-methylcitrate dehydratase PrpD